MISGPVAQGITGSVRSYNGSKGYGFISGPPGPFNDVMFARNELPIDAKEVRGNFLEGRTVNFDAQLKPDGRAKATSVQIIAEEGKELPGVIKSYSERHGYGFLTSTCLEDDVRFQASDFPPLKPGVELKGGLVLFETMQSSGDGKLKVAKVMFQTKKIAEQFLASSGMPGNVMPGMGRAGVGVDLTGFVQQAALMGMAGGGELAALTGLLGMKRGADMISVRQPGQPAIKQKKPDVAVTSTGKYMPGISGIKQPKSSPVEVTATGKQMSGHIKSYNPTKGWGLISSPGIPSGGAGKAGDVFFMKSNLPVHLRDTELGGQNVSYELMRAPDGKLRADKIMVT